MPQKRHHSSGHHSQLAPHKKITVMEQKNTPAVINKKNNPGKKIAEAHKAQAVAEEPPNSDLDAKVNQILEMVKSLPAIQSEVTSIAQELREHQKSIEWVQGEVEDVKNKLQTEEERTSKLEEEVRVVRSEMESYRKELDDLKEHFTNLDTYTRRDNLIFLNIQEEEDEDCNKKITTILSENLEVDNIRLTRVHRLGEYKPGFTRAIIARFHFFPDRMKVWQNRNKLKGTKIILKEDYPEVIQKARKTLQPFFNHAKMSGKKVKMVKDSLVIEGKLYKTSTIKTLPPELIPTPDRTITYEDKEYILFAGKECPFSNWHYAPFKLDEKDFNSSEQYYAYHKAMYVNDNTRAAKILQVEDPRVIKRISAQIEVPEEAWVIRGTMVMRKGLVAKFQQNPQLKTRLLATGNATLVECTRDSYWACGISFNSRDVNNPSKWTGKNMQGQLLSEVRMELQEDWSDGQNVSTM